MHLVDQDGAGGGRGALYDYMMLQEKILDKQTLREKWENENYYWINSLLYGEGKKWYYVVVSGVNQLAGSTASVISWFPFYL